MGYGILMILLLLLLNILVLIGKKNIKDKKNTSSACFFIGDDCLVAWLSKKQNSISLSTTEAKYIVVRSCYTQLLLMKQMLNDYGIEQGTMNIHYYKKHNLWRLIPWRFQISVITWLLEWQLSK